VYKVCSFYCSVRKEGALVDFIKSSVSIISLLALTSLVESLFLLNALEQFASLHAIKEEDDEAFLFIQRRKAFLTTHHSMMTRRHLWLL